MQSVLPNNFVFHHYRYVMADNQRRLLKWVFERAGTGLESVNYVLRKHICEPMTETVVAQFDRVLAGCGDG